MPCSLRAGSLLTWSWPREGGRSGRNAVGNGRISSSIGRVLPAPLVRLFEIDLGSQEVARARAYRSRPTASSIGVRPRSSSARNVASGHRLAPHPLHRDRRPGGSCSATRRRRLPPAPRRSQRSRSGQRSPGSGRFLPPPADAVPRLRAPLRLSGRRCNRRSHRAGGAGAGRTTQSSVVAVAIRSKTRRSTCTGLSMLFSRASSAPVAGSPRQCATARRCGDRDPVGFIDGRRLVEFGESAATEGGHLGQSVRGEVRNLVVVPGYAEIGRGSAGSRAR